MLVTAIACLALLLPILGLALGYKTMIVAGGSMEPFASVGDAIVLRVGTGGIGPGDVISFTPLQSSGVVTHRVLKELRIEGIVYYQTQGDANATPDPNLVPSANVLGTVVGRVPNLGVFYAFATSVLGRLVLVVVPALVIGWGELRELIRWRRRRLRLRARLSATTLGLVALMCTAGPAAGVFVETSAVSSNAFATSSVNPPDLTSAVGGSTLLNCRVTLNWTAPVTGLAPDGYDIYRSTTNGGPYSLVQHVGVSTSFVDNGLGVNTTYYYVLQSSRSSWRSVNSNQRSATTPLLCA